MKTIRVFGDLAKRLGQRVFRASVSSAAEAVRFLIANFPWLEVYMRERQYKVFVNTYNLALENLHEPVSSIEEILICPVIEGAGAIGRIIVGAVLIVAAFFTFGITLFFGVTLGGILFTIGAALLLGGIAELLAPKVTDTGKDTEEIESYNFSGLANVSRQGVPVPVCYGEIVTGSVVISGGIIVGELGSIDGVDNGAIGEASTSKSSSSSTIASSSQQRKGLA
jgi:predicted phage tail protein